jgi:HK97 family phage portal protein
LLKHEANPDMSAFEFRRTLQAHALTCKGGFAEIERDGAGQPAALWPMTPDRVTPFIEKTKLPNGNYRTPPALPHRRRQQEHHRGKDMIHIRGLGYDGYCAYRRDRQGAAGDRIALAAERFAGAFFGNNSNLGGVLAATPGPRRGRRPKDLQERIERLHKGPDRAWRMLVLGAGFKYFRTGVTPSESQMDDLRNRKQVEEVARFFNMPVHKLKNLDRATNNNIEQQDLEYYKGHQLTWITNWEQELNRKLVPARNRQQYFKHNANAVLRADTAADALYARCSIAACSAPTTCSNSRT